MLHSAWKAYPLGTQVTLQSDAAGDLPKRILHRSGIIVGRKEDHDEVIDDVLKRAYEIEVVDDSKAGNRVLWEDEFKVIRIPDAKPKVGAWVRLNSHFHNKEYLRSAEGYIMHIMVRKGKRSIYIIKTDRRKTPVELTVDRFHVIRVPE